MDLNNFTLICLGCLSAIVTFILNEKLKQGPVRASAFIGFIVGLFFYVFPSVFNPYLSANIPLVCFGASFIGMASSKVVSNYFYLGISACIFTSLYLHSSAFFEGFGGALGITACISLLITIGLSFVLNKAIRVHKYIIYKNQYFRWKFKR